MIDEFEQIETSEAQGYQQPDRVNDAIKQKKILCEEIRAQNSIPRTTTTPEWDRGSLELAVRFGVCVCVLVAASLSSVVGCELPKISFSFSFSMYT